MSDKMKIEIWSDIVCPFCYIGKRRFESALNNFSEKDKIEIIWKSFQLEPDIDAAPDMDVYTYLAERKGQSREWSEQMHHQVTQMAREAGLDYRFDKARVANTFNAHQLIKFAATFERGGDMKERLLKAYFTDGELVSDHSTLARLAADAGLDSDKAETALKNSEFADAVKQDLTEAAQLGIRGVPFFLLNRKYAVSGAQAPETFAKALTMAFGEWQNNQL